MYSGCKLSLVRLCDFYYYYYYYYCHPHHHHYYYYYCRHHHHHHYLRFTFETVTHAPDSNNRIVKTSAVHLSTNDGSVYCEHLMAGMLGPANTVIR